MAWISYWRRAGFLWSPRMDRWARLSQREAAKERCLRVLVVVMVSTIPCFTMKHNATLLALRVAVLKIGQVLDPQRVRVFRTVVAEGSVQAAADLLAMTSSAVSQQLATLARETGLTLFRREGRGIVPTPVARRLSAATGDALAGWQRLDEVVAELREGRIDRLTIGYFESAGSTWMPALLRRLRREFPDVTLELVLSADRQAEAPALDLDLVISDPNEAPPAGYRKVDLVVDPFVLVVPHTHSLAGRERVPLRELRDETFISNDNPRSREHRIVMAACTAAGYQPIFTVQAQDPVTAMRFVAVGLGVSVVPSLSAQTLPAGVARVTLVPAPVRHIAAFVQDRGAPSPPADRALALLTDLATRSGRPLSPRR